MDEMDARCQYVDPVRGQCALTGAHPLGDHSFPRSPQEPPPDESAFTPEGRVQRNRKRMSTRWQADLYIVETADGALHVATCSGGAVAAHIAELHNRTFGDGQDPPEAPAPGSAADETAQVEAALANAAQDYAEGVPGAGPCMDYLRLGLPPGPLRRDSIRRAFLAGYGKGSATRGEDTDWPATARLFIAAQRGNPDAIAEVRRLAYAALQGMPPAAYPDTAAFLATLAEVLPPGVGAHTRHQPAGRDIVRDTAGKIDALIDAEVRARVAMHAAREPARVVIDGSPKAMARTLSKLGYVVRTPEEAEQDRKDRLAPVVIELTAAPDNGVRLLLDGVEEVHVNDGDSGGAGLTLGIRALAGKLGIEVIEP